jgi:hypothetical protein
MDWEKIAPDFAPDGSVRDIYVLGAGLPDWQRVVDALRASATDLVYLVDDIPTELPSRVEDALAEWQRGRTPLLRFQVGTVAVLSYFFTPDEVEFSFRPEQVAGLDRLEPLLEFMEMLGELTGKEVILTPESLPASPIFRLDPSVGRAVFTPPPA